MALIERKQKLRREIRAALEAVPKAELKAAGDRVAAGLRPLLSELASSSPGPAVAFFASLPYELDTSPLDELLRELRLTRVLPSYRTGSLAFHELSPQQPIGELPRDRLGIPTPPEDARERHPAECSLLLVPGLAFDSEGGRLGQGGGYYDRALAKLDGTDDPPLVIGLCLDLQMRPRVPMGPEDRRVDGVCTPATGVRLTDGARRG